MPLALPHVFSAQIVEFGTTRHMAVAALTAVLLFLSVAMLLGRTAVLGIKASRGTAGRAASPMVAVDSRN